MSSAAAAFGREAARRALLLLRIPEPDGFSAHRVEPDTAYFSDEHKEFLLPTKRFAPPITPTVRAQGSCRPRTRRPPNLAAGTAARLKTTRTACHRCPHAAVSVCRRRLGGGPSVHQAGVRFSAHIMAGTCADFPMYTNAYVRVGQRRCSPAPRTGAGIVHVDVDRRPWFPAGSSCPCRTNRAGATYERLQGWLHHRHL